MNNNLIKYIVNGLAAAWAEKKNNDDQMDAALSESQDIWHLLTDTEKRLLRESGTFQTVDDVINKDIELLVHLINETTPPSQTDDNKGMDWIGRNDWTKENITKILNQLDGIQFYHLKRSTIQAVMNNLGCALEYIEQLQELKGS